MKREIAVVAAILRKNGTVLLAQRGQGKYLAGYWELPGGKIEHGETPEAALSRELAEELGISALIGPFFKEHRHEYPEFTINLASYLVQSYTGNIHPIEHERICWIYPEQSRDYHIAPADIPIIDEMGSLPLLQKG